MLNNHSFTSSSYFWWLDSHNSRGLYDPFSLKILSEDVLFLDLIFMITPYQIFKSTNPCFSLLKEIFDLEMRESCLPIFPIPPLWDWSLRNILERFLYFFFCWKHELKVFFMWNVISISSFLASYKWLQLYAGCLSWVSIIMC